MSFKLPPLNFSKEIERLEKIGKPIHHEQRKVEMGRCKHKNARIINNELRCPDCGASWTGANLQKLLQYFTT